MQAKPGVRMSANTSDLQSKRGIDTIHHSKFRASACLFLRFLCLFAAKNQHNPSCTPYMVNLSPVFTPLCGARI